MIPCKTCKKLKEVIIYSGALKSDWRCEKYDKIPEDILSDVISGIKKEHSILDCYEPNIVDGELKETKIKTIITRNGAEYILNK